MIHEVKNGQSLWAIAIEYGTKIDQIRLLNNLPSTDIYNGQKLLVLKGATQPATSTAMSTLTPTPRVTLTPRPSQTPTPQPTDGPLAANLKANMFSISAVIVATLFIVGFIISRIRKNT